MGLGIQGWGYDHGCPHNGFCQGLGFRVLGLSMHTFQTIVLTPNS